VDGAGILSKPKAKRLRVIACPGRRNVNITVGPPGSGIRKHATCKIRPRRR
jgi:hypothetical protein